MLCKPSVTEGRCRCPGLAFEGSCIHELRALKPGFRVWGVGFRV